MNAVKLTSVRQALSSKQFKENFNNVEFRYSEICIDHLNRQLLQIDFVIKEDFPYYGADLALFGEALTDFFNDRAIPAVLDSCTTNSINRLYYRAFVKFEKAVSDPEVERRKEKLKKPSSRPTESAVGVEQSKPVKESSIIDEVLKSARKPGDLSGLGYPTQPFVPAQEPDVPAPPQPSAAAQVPLQPRSNSDRESKSLIDKQNLKIFALEQEVVNLKAKVIDKETEIKALADRPVDVPKPFSFDQVDSETVRIVRRAVSKTFIPLKSEKLFVQHHVGRTAIEIMLDTYYLCEYLGLRDDALSAMLHIIENLYPQSESEATARLMYSLMMPHIKFLIRRNDEMRR